MHEKIKAEIEKIKDLPKGTILSILDKKLYKEMPKDSDAFVEVCNDLIETNEWRPYWLVTSWIKRKKTPIDIKYFHYYEKWLYEYTNNWWACDVFCNRVLNPLIEKYPELFNEAIKWAHSDKTYIKRAAAVCLIKSNQSFSVNVSFEKVKKIVDILISDNELHVQKGIGWLLKYAYLSYPHETIEYLKDNVSLMSRTTFRYALKKMDHNLKTQLMKL